MPPSLDDHLTKLEDTGLIQLARLEPDLEYLFRHALVQDATYESLLKQDRRMLHRVVGETLESLYPDRLETLAPALAHHFDEAKDSERALHYTTLAADQAFAQYANEEAIEFYTRALQIADSMHNLPAGTRIPLYRNLGRARELRGEYEKALELYQSMRGEGEQRADSPAILAALLAQAIIQATPTPVQNPELAIELSERAIDLARTLGDRAAEARALWTIGLSHMYGTGKGHKAMRFMEESLVIAHELDLREQIAYTLTDLSNVRTLMGSGVTAAEGLSEARALWRSLGNKPMLCFCLSLSAEVHTYLGELDSALAMVQESLDMSTAIGNAEGLAYACTMMGSIYAMRGDAGTAIDLLHQGIDTANSTSSGILALISVYILSSLYGTIGACDQALALKEELVQTGMMQKMPPLFVAQMLLETGGADRACTDPHSYLESTAAIVQQALERNSGIAVEQWAGASLAAAHLAVGEPEAALNHIDQFLTLSTQNNWRTRTAEALELRARVLRALGRPDEEAATLAEARQLADEIGLANVQWRVVAALAENEDHKGNRDEAASLRREARAILNRIAESLTDPHLKRGLLAQPEVRALIRGGSAA